MPQPFPHSPKQVSIGGSNRLPVVCSFVLNTIKIRDNNFAWVTRIYNQTIIVRSERQTQLSQSLYYDNQPTDVDKQLQYLLTVHAFPSHYDPRSFQRIVNKASH